MSPFETYYRNPKIYGIAGVAAANTGQSIIVNGNFVFQIDPPILASLPGTPRMTKRCNGRIIQGGALNSQVSTDSTQAPSTSGASTELCGPNGKYLAQSGTTFTFGVGEVPLKSGYQQALGGLSTNFGVRAADGINVIGEATVKHCGAYKVIFTAQTDPRVNYRGDSNGTLQFKKDAETAGASHWVILDGGTSLALAYADPNSGGTMTVQYGGVKHGTIIGYYVNTFLMFKCTPPRQ